MSRELSLITGLRLMQLADSAFPAGGFTQSFGLETFVQRGDIKTGQDLTGFMQTYLYYTWRPTDLLALKLAWLAAGQEDRLRLSELDRRLNAMKVPAESREGSVKMGRQLRRLLVAIDAGYVSGMDLPFGHQAIILGHYGAAAKIDLSLLLAAYGHMTAAALVANGVRAVPLGQTAGQQVLAVLQPLLAACIQWVSTAQEHDWGGSAPAIDWAGMAHEGLYSRIFMS
ncbi:MAG TPA: urease accessory UreF family protein [Desulfitobacteriaceae bacterium]|nr:urease accessory UreF family protein [Desulfitobacteriaceae bacterium]